MTYKPNGPLPIAPNDNKASESFFVGDSVGRIGRLENQMNQILIEFTPVLGTVAEAVKGLGTSLEDIKIDLREVRKDCSEFKVKSSTFEVKIQEQEAAKTKGEDYYIGQRIDERKGRIDRRNRILGIIGTAVASVAVAVVVTWLHLK